MNCTDIATATREFGGTYKVLFSEQAVALTPQLETRPNT